MHAFFNTSPAVSALLTQNLLTWSEQAFLLAAAAALVSFAMAHPKGRLTMWQTVLLILLLLPLIEPWRTPPLQLLAPAATADASIEPVAASTQAIAPHWRTEYWLYLIAAGAALRLIWAAAGLLRLRGYRLQAVALAEPPLRFASGAAVWCVSDSIPGPVTYGWRRPVILLPSRILNLPVELCEAIQCHELIHVRRRDWLFVLGEMLIRAVLWFHPAVWFVLNRIQLAREQVVDSEAIALLQNRDRYLDALVAVAHYQLRPDLAPAPSFLRKPQLVARVRAVIEEVPMSRSRIAIATAAACSILPMAAGAAVWLFPFVAQAQTVIDGPGVTVNPGAVLLHRAPVRIPNGPAVSGTVILEATLASNGEVSDARVISGPAELRKDALSSVLEWHYQPGPSFAQISIQFAAPATSTATAQLAQPSPSAFVPVPRLGAPGGRGPAAPASAVPATFPATVKSINVVGLTPEGEQQLRAQLPLHVGDTVTQSDVDNLRSTLQAFDTHLSRTYLLSAAPGGGSEVTLNIRTLAQPQAAFAPPPPPPPPTAELQNVPPGVQRISSAVQAAKLIQGPKPAYPPIAKQARIQGSVTLQALIAKDGTVQSLQVLSSQNPLLTPAAIDAVKNWVYQPTLLNDEPVAVATTVTVNFSLQD